MNNNVKQNEKESQQMIYYAFNENMFKELVQEFNNSSFKTGALRFADSFERALNNVVTIQAKEKDD